MNDPRFFLFDLPREGRPEPFRIDGFRSGACDRSADRALEPIERVRALVVHATAGVGSSELFGDGASWHWIVPGTREEAHGRNVWVCLPEASPSPHVREDCSHPAVNGGRERVGEWSVAVQIVNSRRRDIVEPFSEWQVAAAATICRYCWAKCPNLSHVVSHALLDPGLHSDPGAHFPWARFRDLVLNHAGGAAPSAAFVGMAAPAGAPSAALPSAHCCALHEPPQWDRR